MKNITLAIQMDEISSINIKSDSTFVLAMEAQRRGYKILYYQPDMLSYNMGKVEAKTYDLTLYENKIKFYELANHKITNLEDVDIVLMRQDPPFNLKYITYTHLLEMVSEKTLIINNPVSVRNCPEKILPLQFPDLIPPTVISMDYNCIYSFYKKHKQIILKPLYAHGGQDIFYIQENDANFSEILTKLLNKYGHPVVAQSFINDIYNGDKRIIMINGEISGLVKRIPKEGSVISNLVQGAKGIKSDLTERDIQICNKLSPYLKKSGLCIAGLDLIGDYLIEINVTSPTAIKSINDIYNQSIECTFWDLLEKRLLK